MLKPPVSAPVIIGPGTPIYPEAMLQTQPLGPEFAVRTAGGPTQINLLWDSLLEAADHIDAASAAFSAIRLDLVMIVGNFVPTMGHLHWQIPGFHTQFTALLAATAGTEQLLSQAGTGAEMAYQAYRDAESDVQGLLSLLLRSGEHETVLEHLISPNGDKSYVYDWLVTTAAISGGLGLRFLQTRFPVVMTVLSTAAAMEREAGLTPALMGRNEQILEAAEPTEFSHLGDGSLSTHLQSISERSADGDIAVSRIDNGTDEPVYTLYLPGIDVDGVDVDQGRSPLSLVDGLGNDSEHMITVAHQALDEAGVPEGATVVPIGFSMGGIHALNMANSKSMTQRYKIPSAATIASPGQNKPVRTDATVTHFADGRDPVPHLLGERHQQSVDRLSIVYDFQNPDSEVESVVGSAHTLEHNIEAISRVEQDPGRWLGPDEIEHLDSLRAHLDGEVRTTVFTTAWRQQDDPDHLLPWEAESLEDLDYLSDALEEGLKEGRSLGKQLPGRKPSSTSPGTVDWDAAEVPGAQP